MKRMLLMLLCMMLSLTACTGKDNPQDTECATTTNEETVLYEPDTPPAESIEYYKNPIIKVNDKNTWRDCGVGDPFVMRWNGRYYMYCSTPDADIGIQCWSSDDLVDWTYQGLCADEKLTMGAYAPEVVYENGAFFMYTSPRGNGHYVLKSNSPTGPFYAVTDNFGLSIDGNVFVDDDGSWHFYCAAYDGIMAYSMSAPDRVDVASGVKIPCDMHGWTEGPMIVKHNGVYYMTYTGNHVWSAGYRIHYAVGSSPLTFQTVQNNPLLLSTDSKTVKGIGHSSTVLGPNLDEYYIVYHSYKIVPQRDMNIDRIVFNGSETVVLGPTTTHQQAPKMPDLYCRFEGEDELADWTVVNGSLVDEAFLLSANGSAVSKERLEDDYTAEYNFKAISGKAGILFGYQDEQNYARATLDIDASELTLVFMVNGNRTEHKAPVTASFSENLRKDALILFSVRKSGEEYTVCVNNREVLSCKSALGSGAVGVFCEEGTATVGFVGATNGVLQSTLKDVYKPVEGPIPAFSCMEDTAELKVYDGVKYLHAMTGNTYTYQTRTSKSGNYDLILEYRSNSACVLEIFQDDIRLGELSLPSSKGTQSRIALRSLTLNSGTGIVTFRVKSGISDLLSFSFHRSEAVEEKSYDFQNATVSAYKDGDWSFENGKLVLKSDFGKYMIGSANWSNYVVETDISVNSDDINAGLCVRVSNPATTEENSTRFPQGSDYLQGYFIGLGNGSIVLGKQNYDWKELQRVSLDVKKGQTYRIKVEVNENTLRISVDGRLIMTYQDTDSPFLHGMVGYRVHSSSISVDHLTVRPLASEGSSS